MVRRRFDGRAACDGLGMDRRRFLQALGASSATAGVVLGVPSATRAAAEPAVETNIAEFLKAPRGKHALPGPFPGRVVQVTDPRSMKGDTFDGGVVSEMVRNGIATLTGQDLAASFRLLFDRSDVVGIKVNPVGPPLISVRLEVVDALVAWLTDGGIAPENIVIWDRFDSMLKDAGFTRERFPGLRVEGLQTMDEEGDSWRDAGGRHVSEDRFDRETYYFAKGVVGKAVRGYKDDEAYRNQHVFAGEQSYFGKLLTQRVTKIVNVASFKNTGHGISMATKNLGYGSLCNTGRLHAPLFFNVCTEVLAAPVIRDKLVLNVLDALRGQYDGGPDKNAQFVYPNHTLYLATDPFAMDMIGHQHLVAKRREMGVAVNDHPRFTDYLFYAEGLGLGVVSPGKIELRRQSA
jgi:hypothetical protein